MDDTDPITNEADIINRADVTARLAWLKRRLATPVVIDGLPDLDAVDRQEEYDEEDAPPAESPEEHREHAALAGFLTDCDSAVGGGQDWGAVRDSYWDTYAADMAQDLFGDAVLQEAWSDEHWAMEYADEWHIVHFGAVAYRVRP